jgi:HEAT repeat protein
MEIEALLKDKGVKAKGKVQAIANGLLADEIKVEALIKIASKLKDVEKGTCVEALEFATRTQPEIANQKCLTFVIKCLSDEAPRVKWEAAKVIGNIAHLFLSKLDEAINGLLINSEYPGTVVRWSAAHALAKIIALKTKHNTELIPAVHAIVKREEDNAIKKIYLAGIKKAEKK